MFNCYRVFLGGALFAIVRTEIAAQNLIKLYSEQRHPAPVMSYNAAYIEGIGF